MLLKYLCACIWLVALTGCQTFRHRIALIPGDPSESDVHPASSQPIPYPPDANLVFDQSPEIQRAMEKFVETGKAPVIKREGFVQYPFGEVQPVLNCQPNFGCDVELQAGETIKAVILGNEPLWDYLVWESNQQAEAVPHVTIGPRTSQTRTNAVIGTDRRTYHLELLSTGKLDYVRSAKFYYPRERLAQFQGRKDKQERKTNNKKANADGASPLGRLSFAWKVDASSSVRWKPVRVYDDSAHVYIEFPPNVVIDDFPGVYTPTSDGALAQPTWRTAKADPDRGTGPCIMVDGAYEELRLVSTNGDKTQTVVIRRAR